MFQDLNSSEKHALHVLVNLNLPTEVCAFSDNVCEKGDDEEELEGLRNCWSDELLRMLAEELQLTSTSAYLPLILSNVGAYKSIDGDRYELCAPYVAALTDERLTAAALYIKILIFLIISRKFDGRGRVLLRNLVHTLDMPAQDGVWIECYGKCDRLRPSTVSVYMSPYCYFSLIHPYTHTPTHTTTHTTTHTITHTTTHTPMHPYYHTISNEVPT
jgi:hypothetical protein